MEPSTSSASSNGWLGKYRLIAKLGQGGMADVYLGLSQEADGRGKLLVLKRLRNIEDEEATAMFLDEAKIAVRLQHPNVVQTYEVGCEDDALFIVMEFLHGPTLQQLRRKAASQGGLPLRFELFILSQTLRGLQYAHELTDAYGVALRIVHRDFTPQNIIITHQGMPKILDFGIAKAADSAVQTEAGMYKGKLSYMPPEQLVGKKIDHRADLFAAGAMLFQALTGKALWEGADSNVILRRLAMADIPPLKGVKADVAPELVELCRRALAARPEARLSTAQDMRRTLDAYCRFAGLRVSQEEMATYVQELFAQEHEEQERLIERQLGHARSLPLATSAGAVVGLPQMPSVIDPRRVTGTSLPPVGDAMAQLPIQTDEESEQATDSGLMQSIDIEMTGDYPQPAPSWHRWAVLTAALVTAALLAFLLGKAMAVKELPPHARARAAIIHRRVLQ